MEQTETKTTNGKAKSNLQAVTEAGRKGLETTGRITTKVLDFADKIDRWFDLHGGKLKWFVLHLKCGFQNKVCTSKSPTFFGRGH